MGGLVTNPPPPEAPEYPPENNFDPQAFTNQIAQTLQDKGVLPTDWKDALAKAANPMMTLLTWIADRGGAAMLLMVFKQLLEQGEPLIKQLVTLVGAFMTPAMKVLGDLTGMYTGQLVAGQATVQRGDVNNPHPKMETVAAGMFDSILAPLAGLVGARNPQDAGAGQANAQFAMGSIVNIHLATWMINIISNVTGMGALKWINSFDDVITTAINSRSMGRIAMKPYLTKFMADPLTRDLNVALPLDKLSSASLMKSYIRGAITREALVNGMRGLGFDEGVTEQVLVDTVKHLGLDELVWLVNRGAWTKEQAWDDLKQQGYPDPYAPVIFEYAQSALQRSIWRGIASDLVTAIGNHQIDQLNARHILENSELSPDEVNAYMTRGALQAETPKRISYSQLKQLYAESLIDLDRVLVWLEEENYSAQDADLLVLLEFTKHEDRVQRAADLAERRRVADEDARRAKVLLELSQAARAAKYGIPWPPP
jgi:hypothetical protein